MFIDRILGRITVLQAGRKGKAGMTLEPRGTDRRTDRRVVVIADNLRYHHAALHERWRESTEPWFKVEFRPIHSQHLKRIERVRKLTLRLATHDRYFPVIYDVIATVGDTIHRWRKGSESLRCPCAIT
jgi:transposase